MKTFTPVEWQSFSLKKDIERISGKLADTNGFQLSFYAEIALAIFSVGFQNIFDDDDIQRQFWMIIAITSALIFLAPCMVYIYRKIKETKYGSKIITTKGFIDSFDNEVCYYVLMADSYFEMFKNNYEDMNIEKDIKQFYYIETSYYLNKSIMELVPIYNIRSHVLTNNKDDVVSKRMISYARYYNTYNIINKIYDSLCSKDQILDGLSASKLIIESNEIYRGILKDINVLAEIPPT